MKYVITGGPCSGKTWTLREIKKLGYHVVDETATIVKEEEQAKKNPILPDNNFLKFENKILIRQLTLEAKLDKFPAFLDRSLVDMVPYFQNRGIALPEELQYAIETNRYTKVFLLTPWPEYQKTKVRQESAEKAKKLHELTEQAYREAGYEPIKVPLVEAPERAEYIIKHSQ